MDFLWRNLKSWHDRRLDESLETLYSDKSPEWQVDMATRRTLAALKNLAHARHPQTAALGYAMVMKEAVGAGPAGAVVQH